MVREGVSGEGHDEDHEHKEPTAPSAGGASARYDIGPGFEIAIRAALNKPMEVRVREENREPRRRPPSADREHRHETLENRLDAVERALLLIVDQLKAVDANIAELSRRLPRS